MRETIIVTGLEVANFMIDQGCEMIGLDGVPETLKEARMIFRSENVFDAYGRALCCQFSELTENEFDRILSMISLLSLIEKMKLEEEQEVSA